MFLTSYFSLIHIYFEYSLDVLAHTHYIPELLSFLVLSQFAVLINSQLPSCTELLPLTHLPYYLISLLFFHIDHPILCILLFEPTAHYRVPKRGLSFILVLPNLICIPFDMTPFVRIELYFRQLNLVQSLRYFLLFYFFHLFISLLVCWNLSHTDPNRYCDSLKAIKTEVDTIFLELSLPKFIRLVHLNHLWLVFILVLAVK